MVHFRQKSDVCAESIVVSVAVRKEVAVNGIGLGWEAYCSFSYPSGFFMLLSS